MIWFTSDTHFGHENVLKFTDRPWETIWQMNDAIVDSINGRVAVDDELYILGDFSFKMTAQDAYGLRKRIACRRIHLVPGNHDKDWTQPAVAGAFTVEPPICVLKIDGQKIVLSHYPMADWQYRKEGRSWWPEEMPSEKETEHCRSSLDRVGWKVDYVVTHEAPAALARELCRERGREYRGDPLQTFLGELDGRLGYRVWFFGHYHRDKWCDTRHRLIYRDIVPIEDAAPGSRNLLKAL